MTTWSHLLPRSVRGVITSFQSQYDRYFTVPNPLVYFREYHLDGHYPQVLLELKQCSSLFINIPDEIEGKYFKNLREMQLLDTEGPLTDDMAPYLTNLKCLKVGEDTQCDPASFRFLVGLEQFEWYGNPTLMNGNKIFKYLTNLLALSCHYTITKNLDRSIVARMSSLRCLLFRHNRSIDNAILKSLPCLEILNISDRITDEGLEPLKNVHSLCLSTNRGVTYTGLHGKPLRVLLCPRDLSFLDHRLVSFSKTLEVLSLGESQGVSDKTLEQLPRLRELVINGNTRITDRGIRALPRLQLLSVGSSQGISDAGIAALADLHFLSLCGNYNITGACLKALTKLKYLGLGSSTEITPQVVRHAQQLEVLYLGRNRRVASGDLTTLSKMKTIYLGENSRPPLTVPNVEIRFEMPDLFFNLGTNSFYL